MKSNIILISFLSTLTVFACKKHKLDQRPIGQLEEIQLANKKGVEGLLIGAYSMLDGFSRDERGVETGGWGSAASNWIYGSICGSEAHTGSLESDQPDIRNIERFAPGLANPYLAQKWTAVYAGVYRANTVLRVMRKAKDMSSSDTLMVKAEALFLRGFFHFEAVKMWKYVPFADETILYEAGNYYLSNDSLIWKNIEKDFEFAAANLPTTQPGAIGRVNKYAALAFLAKVYLFQHKFSEALPLLQNLITNGVTASGKKYTLVNYSDNFNAASKNNAESVFSAQMSVNDDALGANGNWGDGLNFPYGGGPSGCCGFFRPSQWLVNHFKTDAVSGLPDFENFNASNVTDDMNVERDDPFTPYSGPLDPRLDWTVGRRGIPYLDWGNHPGKAWARDPGYSGVYTSKKNVYYKSQGGILTDTWGSLTANNVNLVRYADILLWAAEAEVEAGTLEKAREYINKVRARAADTTGWVHTYIDFANPARGNTTLPAANYKVGLYPGPWTSKEFAIKAIRYERVLELAMEGHRFFDLVRWKVADSEINGFLQKEKTLRSYLNNAIFIKNKNEYFPIPQSEIDKSAGLNGIPRLKQNAGY